MATASPTNLTISFTANLLSTQALLAAANPTVAKSFNLANLATATWNKLWYGRFVIFNGAPTGVTATLATGGSLSQPQAYYYKVTGTGPYGVLGPANANGVSATTETQGSSEVTATTDASHKTITIQWTALQGATGYKIYRGTVAATENTLIATITSGSTTTFTDDGTEATSVASPPSAPALFNEFDISAAFTELDGDAGLTLSNVLALAVFPTGTGSTCQFAPGTANGWEGPFVAGTQGVTLNPSGCLAISDPATGSGWAVTGAHKTIRVTNGGSAALTVDVILLGD